MKQYSLIITIFCKFCLIITILTKNAIATNVNDSDIFVSYSDHSEVKNIPIFMPKSEYVDDRKSIPELITQPPTPEYTKKPEREDVIFIPNDKPVIRNEDKYLKSDPVKIDNIINDRKLSDVLRNENTLTKSEKPNEDILFVSGKNNENIVKDKNTSNGREHAISKSKNSKDKAYKVAKLDCRNLDCNRTLEAVCGGRLEDKKWKYRVFLNECFYRKVNCAFKYPNNRYKLLSLEKCINVGNHLQNRPQAQPVMINNLEETRRSFSSRRSLNMGINGQPCSHSCPVSCPERYDPQCAVSSNGQRRTFMNHCQLDHVSCLYRIAWYARPLAECVGGRKADLQQNRGFIAWMQKVGIVDNRGRLTLSELRQKQG